MNDPPEHLEDYTPLIADIRRRVELAQTRGMSEPVIARVLLDMSFEAALRAEAQEIFDHILWTNSEAKRFMENFHEKLGDLLDPEALAQGIVKPKA